MYSAARQAARLGEEPFRKEKKSTPGDMTWSLSVSRVILRCFDVVLRRVQLFKRFLFPHNIYVSKHVLRFYKELNEFVLIFLRCSMVLQEQLYFQGWIWSSGLHLELQDWIWSSRLNNVMVNNMNIFCFSRFPLFLWLPS